MRGILKTKPVNRPYVWMIQCQGSFEDHGQINLEAINYQTKRKNVQLICSMMKEIRMKRSAFLKTYQGEV